MSVWDDFVAFCSEVFESRVYIHPRTMRDLFRAMPESQPFSNHDGHVALADDNLGGAKAVVIAGGKRVRLYENAKMPEGVFSTAFATSQVRDTAQQRLALARRFLLGRENLTYSDISRMAELLDESHPLECENCECPDSATACCSPFADDLPNRACEANAIVPMTKEAGE